MVIHMRTTLIIDDHVFMEAKRRAIEAGITVSELTTLALREALRKRVQPPHPGRFSLLTFGSGPKQDSPVREIANFRDQGR
ncbi:MAG TPA: hypothetical protein P5022_12890 [Candidatus Paceibacterota bacterium]|nr:hypothetical protein [Verrucomicrobiota bacterium]HRZ93798.1 hypothetical protein [Candidatus Paceibacterota bacterium]